MTDHFTKERLLEDRPDLLDQVEGLPLPFDSPKTEPGGTGAAPNAVADAKVTETQTQRLLRFAESAELFHTPDQKPYATIQVSDHKENWHIESTRFRQFLRRQYYLDARAAPRSQALQDAISTLASRAVFDGTEQQVSVRVAAAGNRVFLDLANDSWDVVEIDEKGWTLATETPVRFRRAEGMLPLPVPARGGRVDDLRGFVNVGDDDDWRLILSIILQCFRGQGPYAILALGGEHGSAKSTTTKVLRELVDPSSAGHSGPPSNVRDIVIAATNQWIVSLDNLSRIPDWLSDALCRLATGGGMRTRRLYTDSDETILEVQRPVFLNGIEHVTTRPDLLDRSVVISLPKVCTYRNEEEFWSTFRAMRPKILGAILDAVASALQRLPRVSLKNAPRMADYAMWGTAVEQALGWDDGTFMDAYLRNRASVNETVIEASPVGTAIEKLTATGSTFVGTATELLKELDMLTEEQMKSQRNWPRNPSALRNAVKRLAPNLRMLGIDVELGGRDTTRKRNRIIRVTKSSSVLSETSANQRAQYVLEWATADNPTIADTPVSEPSAGMSLKIRAGDGADGPDSQPSTSEQQEGEEITEVL